MPTSIQIHCHPGKCFLNVENGVSPVFNSREPFAKKKDEKRCQASLKRVEGKRYESEHRPGAPRL